MKKPAADIERMHSAIEVFTRRGIPPEAAGRIFEKARRAAIRLSHKATLDMVVDAYRASQAAKAAGEDFKAFKAKLIEDSKKRWATPTGQKIQNVLRESVQSAYMQARVEALSSEEMLRARPFWRFTAILDHRTTETCRACSGTVLPADDNWWLSHIPPLHFRCRSTIVSMTPQQTKRFGVTKRPPKEKPEKWVSKEGEVLDFGKMGKEYVPDVSKYPAKFQKAFKAKVERVKEYFKKPKKERRKSHAPDLDKPPTHS